MDEPNSFFFRNKVARCTLWIGKIAIVEFHSAVYKKERTKSITNFEANLIIDSFNSDFKEFNVINVDNKIWEKSVYLIKKYRIEGFRTLDSLQISTALSNIEIDEIISFDNLFNKIVSLETIK